MADTSSETPFQYQPLPDTKITIRLFTIESGDGPIRCSMTAGTIRWGTYSCLSYTWGDATRLERIYLNSRPYFVRRNLYDFLHTARRYQVTEKLWIDAVCINQEDLQEKSLQVRLMGKIYYNSTRVIVWLGKIVTDNELRRLMQVQSIVAGQKPRCWCPKTDGRQGVRPQVQEPVHALLSYLKIHQGDVSSQHCQCDFQSANTLAAWLYGQKSMWKNSYRAGSWRLMKRCQILFRPNEELESELEDIVPTRAELEAWQAILDVKTTLTTLSNASYWSRAWVMQEVILASATVILTPSGCLKLRTLLNLMIEGACGDMSIAHSPRTHLVSLRGNLMVGGSGWFQNESLGFTLLLELTQERLCYDYRDRIYSVVSLTKYNELFEIDYTVADMELYSRCLQHNARHYGDIRVQEQGFVHVRGSIVARQACYLLRMKPPTDGDVVQLPTIVEANHVMPAESTYVSFWVGIDIQRYMPDSSPFALCTRFRCKRGNEWLLVYPWLRWILDSDNPGVWQLLDGKWERMCTLRSSPDGGFGECHARCRCGPHAPEDDFEDLSGSVSSRVRRMFSRS